MKFLPYNILICSLSSSLAFAANPYPDGIITFYNASPNTITAQVNQSNFILLPKQSRDMQYADLSKACSPNIARCKASFLKNNIYSGFATINTVSGVLVNLKLSLKIFISKDKKNIVRHVSIEQ